MNSLENIHNFSTKTRRKNWFRCWECFLTLLLIWSEVQCFSYSDSALGWELILVGRQLLNWNVLEWQTLRMFHGVHLLWVVSICYLQKGLAARYFKKMWIQKVNLIFCYRIFRTSKQDIECFVSSPESSISSSITWDSSPMKCTGDNVIEMTQ